MRGALAAALLVASASAAAQRPTSPPAAPAAQAGDTARPLPAQACDSVLRAATVDSLSTIVSAYLVRSDGGVMTRETADLLLQDFAQRFRVPQPLRLPVLAPGPASLRALAPERRSATAPRELRLQGIYDFTALGDGSAANVRVRLTSLSPEFDSAVVATLESMARDDAMPLATDAEAADSMPLRLAITSGPPHPGRARPLFRTKLPRVAAADAREAPGNPTPAYPAIERALGMDGYVLFELVVGREGRIEPGTVEVLQATSPAFLRAAIPLLDSLRFTPATVGACPVPQVYQLPVRFVATPPDTASPRPRAPR